MKKLLLLLMLGVASCGGGEPADYSKSKFEAPPIEYHSARLDIYSTDKRGHEVYVYTFLHDGTEYSVARIRSQSGLTILKSEYVKPQSNMTLR